MTDPNLSSNEAVSYANEMRRQQFLTAASSLDEELRFYNTPEATADFVLWSNRFWTCDEVVALSLGKNPKVVNRQALRPYVEAWDFAEEYFRRGEFLSEHVPLPEGAAMPAKWFVAALEPIGFHLPHALVHAVGRAVSKASAEEAREEKDSRPQAGRRDFQDNLPAATACIGELEGRQKSETLENPKSKKTYDKLVYALALKAGFDPLRNTSATANIVDLLERNDVRIDRGIVRERLEAAMARKAAGDFDP